MAVHGNIDMAANGHVHGWVWDDAVPTSALNVVACANGYIIASALANEFREDLEQAGIGNGWHGFTLAIPNITIKNNTIHILEMESSTEIGDIPIHSQEPVKKADTLRIIIDVTDILLFLDKHNKLTGIPRVQIEILRAIFANGLFELDKIEFVALSYAARKFEIVNKNDLFAAIDRRLCSDGQVGLGEDGLYHIERHIGFKPFNPDDGFCHEAIFLALGSSPWGISDFFVRVNEFLAKGMRLVLLYHDIIPLVRPDLSTAEMADMFNLFVRCSFMFCDALMSVSSHCAKDVEEFAREHGYVCPPISVLGNGATTGLLVDSGATQDEPYVLVVSTIEKRKNHLVLARAWQKLIRKYGAKIPKLVFVGSFGLDIQPLFDFLRETSCLGGRIQILNNVSDARLVSLYKGCLFTAFPSLYEGWGLPVTESLVFGKVCLCSRASALPEAGLDYCVYFHPEDVDDAANQAEKLIFDGEYRLALEECIAREYTPPQWRYIAEKLIARMREIYRNAHKVGPVLPLGMEVVFWLPQPYPADKGAVSVALTAFSKGYLTNDKLTWDNYCLASALVVAGRFYPRTVDGWQGDPNGNMFRIMLEEGADPDKLNLYLLFEAHSLKQRIEFYCEYSLIRMLNVTPGVRLICLKVADFVVGNEVRLFIKTLASEAVIYKSLLLLSEDNLCARLTLQEKFENYASSQKILFTDSSLEMKEQ